jgi:hypothetical protein
VSVEVVDIDGLAYVYLPGRPWHLEARASLDLSGTSEALHQHITPWFFGGSAHNFRIDY